MFDPIFRDWLEAQYAQGMELAAQSDLLKLEPIDLPFLKYDGIPQVYRVKIFGKGLVREPDGTLAVAEEFHMDVRFASDYLRELRKEELVHWIGPENVWHPNIRPPYVCLGNVCPGYELVPMLHELYEIVTYQNLATHSFLNDAAAEWARNHTDQIPVDGRPLKRRQMEAVAAT